MDARLAMRVFVAGAAGAVGSRLLPLLVEAGHQVVGMTRSAAKADLIRRSGAAAVVADGLDAGAVRAAVVSARPEVIVHEMTSLRGAADMRQFDKSFALSNRLRTAGLDHLLAAAREAGTKRILAQSFCGWPYAHVGGHVKSEEDPLDSDPAPRQRQTLSAIRYLESKVPQARPLAGLVLRYGAFYGPGTGTTDEFTLEQLRRRLFPIVGNGAGWWSFVHIDDAASATGIAVEHGDAGIYNIVDDEPAPVSEWLPVLAAAAGAKPPRHVPKWLGSLLAGRHLATMMTEARAGSNAKARRILGWTPAHSSWRTGFAEAVAAWRDRARV
jgi:2-alkyl-3-oxoalkanoate reductase